MYAKFLRLFRAFVRLIGVILFLYIPTVLANVILGGSLNFGPIVTLWLVYILDKALYNAQISERARLSKSNNTTETNTTTNTTNEIAA